MFSQRKILLKLKGFINRLAFCTGIFFILHYLIFLTLTVFEHGRVYKSKNFSQTDENVFYKPLYTLSSNDMWQVVDDPFYETYLLSAYYDDRPSLSLFQVRIVGVTQFKQTENLICLLWYRNVKQPDIVHANLTLTGEKVSLHNEFQGVVVSCEVPMGRCTPESVSVISQDSYVVANMLTVALPFKPVMPKEIAVCVPPISGDIKLKQFTEWIEILRFMGVKKVTMYDNGINSESLKLVKKSYVDKGLVSLKSIKFPFARRNPSLSKKLIVSAASNDCFYQNMMKYRKIMIINLEEIIIPRFHDDYLGLFTYIDDTLPAHPGRSYLFKGVFFWLDHPPFTEDTPFMTVTRYFMRSPPSSRPEDDRSITDTQVCLALDDFHCKDVLPSFQNFTDWMTKVDANISLVHYYKKCDLDERFQSPGMCNNTLEMSEVDATGSKYIDRVATQVVEVLWQYDFVDIFDLAANSVNSMKESMEADELGVNGSAVSLNPNDMETKEQLFNQDGESKNKGIDQ